MIIIKYGFYVKAFIFSFIFFAQCVVANAAVYTYDKLNRLTSVTYDNGYKLTYEYDAAGNLLTLTTSEYIFKVEAKDPTNKWSTDGPGLTVRTALNSTTNNPPNVDTIIVEPSGPVHVNEAVSVSASFTDPDAGDTHTAVWNWGDGTTAVGAIDENNVKGQHSYSNAGLYTVKLIVSDDKSGVGESFYKGLVIYNPDGGFVTGGGWIDIPEGAYPGDPALSGKATFEFNSKYHKGATVPKGQAKFQINSSRLKFESRSYDWLVITGEMGQCKGSGAINGKGDYGFMLTVIDGNNKGNSKADKFRIKLWEKATNKIVFDSQMEAEDSAAPVTTLGGGSITIHKK